jgi:hypothetical protein
MKEVDRIVYEKGDYWVRLNEKKMYDVYLNVGTHSVRRAIIGFKGDEGLQRAIDNIEFRIEMDKRKAVK